MPQQPQQRDVTTLRNQLAANAPIEYQMVTEALGVYPDLRKQEGRDLVFSTWATLARGWADAMAKELSNTSCKV